MFADIGAGKGRVVYQAARRYGLKRVIGVELSPALAEEARTNLERHRAAAALSTTFHIVTGDALAWEVPDDVTIAYMFRPFTGATFRGVVDNLIASYDRSPRRLRILYVNPEEHDTLMAGGRVRELPTPDEPDRAPPALRLQLGAALRSDPALQRIQLTPQRLRQPVAEAGQVFAHLRQLRAPGLRVEARQLLERLRGQRRAPRSPASPRRAAARSASPPPPPRRRSAGTTQASTRLFSPKPGQRNLPSSSLRNQLTMKIFGSSAPSRSPIASQWAK